MGALMPLAGVVAAPEVIPGLPLAKALQAIAGFGFVLYCLTACLIILTRIRVRRQVLKAEAHTRGQS